MGEKSFVLDDTSLLKRICGFKDRNIRVIEELSGAEIIPRGNTLIVHNGNGMGEHVMRLFHLMSDILQINNASYEFADFDLRYLTRAVIAGKKIKPQEINKLKMTFPDTGKTIVPRTLNQADYISAIERSPVIISTGPAGTGKTFLAVVSGLSLLLQGGVERIILTRPAVEAGESLGYLPGDLAQKINPYLRPLYDALFELQSFEKISRLMEKGNIEVAPLAYMRGRTLNNAFIILDEAQNSTIAQMKMFLTRLGTNSRMVITGDDTQIDLEKPSMSGLLHARKILKGVKEISFIRFTREDISRHPVVEKIVAAYEQNRYND